MANKPWWAERKGTRVAVDVTGPATTVLQAAISTSKLRLLRYALTTSGGAGTFKFAGSGTDITGVRQIPEDGALGETYVGGSETGVNEDLELITTGAAMVLKGDVWFEPVRETNT